MAGELKAQRAELERTHRLEAWAEMARQVAHEIKNPLTPIQLSAEHLRRVHADRGEPLGAVLDECVTTILGQVRLLRQIASEFSSFASSADGHARRAVDVPDARRRGRRLRTGRAWTGRIASRCDVAGDAAAGARRSHARRARAHQHRRERAARDARGGTLSVAASGRTRMAVMLTVGDTGVGMDAEALARVFEPYFSTKTAGTGLGLPIASRNVELSGGTIRSSSARRDRGRRSAFTLPVAAPLAAGPRAACHARPMKADDQIAVREHRRA